MITEDEAYGILHQHNNWYIVKKGEQGHENLPCEYAIEELYVERELCKRKVQYIGLGDTIEEAVEDALRFTSSIKEIKFFGDNVIIYPDGSSRSE